MMKTTMQTILLALLFVNLVSSDLVSDDEMEDFPSLVNPPTIPEDEFKFPEDWNALTDARFQRIKNEPYVFRFISQLRRYVYETEPNSKTGVRRLDLHPPSDWCETFCTERREWADHKPAFAEAKRQVADELEEKGFVVGYADSVTEPITGTLGVTFYGEFMLVR